MRNPKIYDLLLKDEEKLNYLYNWVTDNPAPSNKEKVHHFTHNAPQHFNLKIIKKIQAQKLKVDPDTWDSDEEMINYKFYQNEVIDVLSKGKWVEGKV